MSSGMSLPRAKSLPVPSGSRPTTALRPARCAGSSAAITACRLPSPPATTIRREPARCRTLSSSPGLEVAATSTEAPARSTSSAASRVSSSAVPASLLVMTRSGSTGGTLPGGVLVAWGRKSPRQRLSCCPGLFLFTGEVWHARNRDPRSPVGRRGQGQGDRPARHRANVGAIDYVRPHVAAATTPATRSSSTARSSRPTCCPAASSRPGCTSVIANGVVVAPEALFREIDALEARGVDTSTLIGQRQRARDRQLPHDDRQGHRALPRQEQDRHHRPRHRADVRRQDQPRSASGSPTSSTRGSCSEKVEAALDLKNQVLAKVYNRRAIEVEAVVEELLSYAERLRPMVARHLAAAQPGARRRQDRAVRGRPGHDARRRPRHLPVRDVAATRSPAASASAPASARPGSTG